MERATEAEAANLDGITERERSSLHHLAQLGFGPDASALGLIIAVALILTWHTWARWGDIQVDCGKELYVPLQILKGKVLYRDIWYPYGPLGPYVLTVLIGFLGRHLDVLYWFGIALAAGCALLLYQIGALMEERAAAVLAALVLLFRAFYPNQADYPFAYAYATPLALLLSLLCTWLTVDFLLNRGARKLVAAGFAAGLASLCKPEFGVSCWMMLAFGITADCISQPRPRTLLLNAVRCLPGVAVAAAVYGWFFVRLGVRFVLLDNLQIVPGSYFLERYGAHYDALVGLRFIPAELIFLAVTGAAGFLAWFLIARGVQLRRGSIGSWGLIAGTVILGAALIAARYAAAQGAPGYLFVLMMLVFPPGMYFIGCAFLVYSLYRCFRQEGRAALAEAMFAVFTLTLAVRVMVEVIAYTFPVFYGPPLVLIFAIVLNRCFYAGSSGANEKQRRDLVNVLLAIETVMLAILFVPAGSWRTSAFETSWGTIYLTPGDARVSSGILQFMIAQKRLRRRVAILPEMTMMYALSGTEAPSRWYMLVPGILAPTEEDHYIDEVTRAAPDYIILANERTSAYGEDYFGLDYDRKVYSWIERNYRAVGQFGEFRRNQGAPLAALLYQRRD